MAVKNSLEAVVGEEKASLLTTVKRSSLAIGSLFSRLNGKGRVYMHTGVRTCPPSELGKRTSLGLVGSDHIVGYQSIVVKGTIKATEDGAIVTFNDADVTPRGQAEIRLRLTA